MRFFIKQYNDDYFRLYMTKVKERQDFKNFNNKSTKEEIEEKSLSRTKRNLRELALCNNWQYFCTWTVSSEHADRFSLSSCQNLMHKTLKAYKRINKDFKYLFITEKHKNGAFHFHGFIKGIGDDTYINNNGYLSIKFFDNKVGFLSISKIKDYNKCCNYICKYITKESIKNEHNQIYFCSKGLKKSVPEELVRFNLQDFKDSFHDFNYCTDYIEISDLYYSKLTEKQKMFILSLCYKDEKTIDF